MFLSHIGFFVVVVLSLPLSASLPLSQENKTKHEKINVVWDSVLVLFTLFIFM